jgi:peptide/nickel transport system permease protein
MPSKNVALYLSLIWLSALIILSIAVQWFGADPLAVHLGIRLSPPSHANLLGTDELGRSLLSRLLNGARGTLIVTFFATMLSLSIGAIMGLIAGWYGRLADLLISGLINLFWSIPFAIFAILVLAVVGATTESVVFVIAGVNWVSSARVFRSETLRIRHSEFVRSARALGFSDPNILLHQVFPNLRRTAIVLAGFGATEALSLESGLAYLGLSLPPPLPTWGGMMSDGFAYLSTAWWICLLPALTITITLASFRGAITGVMDESGRYGQY